METTGLSLMYNCLELHNAILDHDLNKVKNIITSINNYEQIEKDYVNLFSTIGINSIITNLTINEYTDDILKCLEYTLEHLQDNNNKEAIECTLWNVKAFPYINYAEQEEVLTFLNSYLDNPNTLKYNYQIKTLIQLAYRFYDANIMNKLKSVLTQYMNV